MRNRLRNAASRIVGGVRGLAARITGRRSGSQSRTSGT